MLDRDIDPRFLLTLLVLTSGRSSLGIYLGLPNCWLIFEQRNAFPHRKKGVLRGFDASGGALEQRQKSPLQYETIYIGLTTQVDTSQVPPLGL